MPANAFVGAWRLLSFETSTSSGEVSYPLGRDAVGLLLYGQEGCMAVSVMRGDRANFKSADIWGAASPEEKLAAFDSYSSYCGRYKVKHDKIIHHVELSLFPNWSGVGQERYFEFAGDRLTLRTPPTMVGGVEQTAIAIWQRVNS
jgi:hypothetical protein